MKRVEFHPAALIELEIARDWYRRRSEFAGIAFIAEVSRAVRRISERPEAWTRTRDNEHRIVLSQFPYSLIYRIREIDVFVTAVAHQRRRPQYWRERH